MLFRNLRARLECSVLMVTGAILVNADVATCAIFVVYDIMRFTITVQIALNPSMPFLELLQRDAPHSGSLCDRLREHDGVVSF